jgi:hypothetical protein
MGGEIESQHCVNWHRSSGLNGSSAGGSTTHSSQNVASLGRLYLQRLDPVQDSIMLLHSPHRVSSQYGSSKSARRLEVRLFNTKDTEREQDLYESRPCVTSCLFLFDEFRTLPASTGTPTDTRQTRTRVTACRSLLIDLPGPFLETGAPRSFSIRTECPPNNH